MALIWFTGEEFRKMRWGENSKLWREKERGWHKQNSWSGRFSHRSAISLAGAGSGRGPGHLVLTDTRTLTSNIISLTAIISSSCSPLLSTEKWIIQAVYVVTDVKNVQPKCCLFHSTNNHNLMYTVITICLRNHEASSSVQQFNHECASLVLHATEHSLSLELKVCVLDLGHLWEAKSEERLPRDVPGGLGLSSLEAQGPGQEQWARDEVRAQPQAPGWGRGRHYL